MAGKAAALAGLLLLGLFAAVGSRAQTARVSACRVSQLAIAPGLGVPEKTGQHTLVVRLANRGRRTCVLDGYPSVVFSDARGVLPFRLKRGGDTMITSRPPKPVAVRPGRSAFALVNKYRCDLGDRRVARRLALGLPGGRSRRLLLRIPRDYVFGFCGQGDPGSTITTSPFERSVLAALTKGLP